jgi:hypothetical protein
MIRLQAFAIRQIGLHCWNCTTLASSYLVDRPAGAGGPSPFVSCICILLLRSSIWCSQLAWHCMLCSGTRLQPERLHPQLNASHPCKWIVRHERTHSRNIQSSLASPYLSEGHFSSFSADRCMIFRSCACTFMPADDLAHEPPSPQQAAATAPMD